MHTTPNLLKPVTRPGARGLREKESIPSQHPDLHQASNRRRRMP
jgi:hypothetical protein